MGFSGIGKEQSLVLNPILPQGTTAQDTLNLPVIDRQIGEEI